MIYALILLGGCAVAVLVMSGVGRLVYGPAWTRSAAQHRVPGAPVYPWTRPPRLDPHPDVPVPRPVVVPPMPDRPPAMVRIRLCDPDPHTADTQPITRVEETAA